MAYQMTTIRGFQLMEVVSALQKAIRRSDEVGAVAWAAEMDQSGYHAYMWQRLRLICSEDVGLAWPEGPSVIRALEANYTDHVAKKRNGSERLFVVHAALLLARAPKSRLCDVAIWAAYGLEEPLVEEIPDHVFDMYTAKGRAMGRGWDYWIETSSHLENMHPDETLDERKSPFWERYLRIKEKGSFFERRQTQESAKAEETKRRSARLFDPTKQ